MNIQISLDATTNKELLSTLQSHLVHIPKWPVDNDRRRLLLKAEWQNEQLQFKTDLDSIDYSCEAFADQSGAFWTVQISSSLCARRTALPGG